MNSASTPPIEAGHRAADEGQPEVDWQADWEGHRRWQLTAALAATPAQRLAWLEEMLELAHRSGALSGPASQQGRG